MIDLGFLVRTSSTLLLSRPDTYTSSRVVHPRVYFGRPISENSMQM